MSGEAAGAGPSPAATPKRLPLNLPGGRVRAGLIATMVLLLTGFVSLVWTPWPTDQTDVAMQLIDPGLAHPFGTDAQGRDVLSLTMKGMLTSYVVAATGIAIGLIVGVPLGLGAALIGRPADWFVRRIGDPLSIVPALAIALALAALSGPGPVIAMVAIGFAAIPPVAQVTWRVAAAPHHALPMALSRLAGLGRWEATVRHVLPDLRGVIVAETLMLLGYAVLAEAALAYAGLAAQPSGMSLGLMLRDAQGAMLFDPVLVLAPGIAVMLIAGALQLAGRGQRALLDPRLRGGEQDNALA